MTKPAATFSPCRRYRYTLWREWTGGCKGYAMFVGLNPSTADETNDDPTVRRCIDFAKRWGYRGLMMCNAFAYRATDPSEMQRQADPVGPDNDIFLHLESADAAIVIAAWGMHGEFLHRCDALARLLPADKLFCLSRTKSGQPRHPLYLPAELTPIPWP